MTLMSPEQKGQRAARILENEVFQESVARARERIKEEWTQTKTQDQREALWHKYQAIEAVPRELRSMEGDAHMEQHLKERENRRG